MFLEESQSLPFDCARVVAFISLYYQVFELIIFVNQGSRINGGVVIMFFQYG